MEMHSTYEAAYMAYQREQRKALAVTVAVAGFKYDVYTLDGELYAVIPRARAAERAKFVKVNGSWDNYFHISTEKLANSVVLLRHALHVSRTVEELIAAIGGATEHCALCGALLTDPVSTARGVGPECIKTIYARGIVPKVMAARVAMASGS